MNIDETLNTDSTLSVMEQLSKIMSKEDYHDFIRRSLARKSKHNTARALRGKARIAKRKAKRK